MKTFAYRCNRCLGTTKMNLLGIPSTSENHQCIDCGSRILELIDVPSGTLAVTTGELA